MIGEKLLESNLVYFNNKMTLILTDFSLELSLSGSWFHEPKLLEDEGGTYLVGSKRTLGNVSR